MIYTVTKEEICLAIAEWFYKHHAKIIGEGKKKYDIYFVISRGNEDVKAEIHFHVTGRGENDG